MAKARTEKFVIGGKEYRLRWDMHALATLEELTGINTFLGVVVNVRNVRAVLWAALDAAAAHNDEDCPIPFRKLGGYFEDEADIEKALRVMTRLVGSEEEQQKLEDAKNPPAAAARPSRSRAATRSAESTSASVSASSGA